MLAQKTTKAMEIKRKNQVHKTKCNWKKEEIATVEVVDDDDHDGDDGEEEEAETDPISHKCTNSSGSNSAKK